MERHSPTVEEGFEDVGLDDQKHQQQQLQQQQQQQQPQPPRRRGFFAKFSDNPDKETTSSTMSQPMSRFLPGRKRAQSGQGAELGNMEYPKVLITSDDAK